jgi:serine/threonine-protein kinase
MGEVWQAHDAEIDRMVALKMLLPHYAQDRTFNQRFRREARAAARLDDPHVVPIYDVGEEQGRLYVTMRLINGRDLQTLLDDGPLEPTRSVRIIEQVAAALHAAHRVGLVHRDIKPSNILLTDDDFAYLIDFGIARAAGETGLTSTGFTIGTWSYMAPERFRDGQVEPSSDIYALACVLYQCLTGQLPFPGTTMEQVAMAHMVTPPPKPSTQRDGIPPAMDDVIATGLAKDPDRRYSTAPELTAAVRAALTPLVSGRSADTIEASVEASTIAESVPPTAAAESMGPAGPSGPTLPAAELPSASDAQKGDGEKSSDQTRETEAQAAKRVEERASAEAKRRIETQSESVKSAEATRRREQQPEAAGDKTWRAEPRTYRDHHSWFKVLAGVVLFGSVIGLLMLVLLTNPGTRPPQGAPVTTTTAAAPKPDPDQQYLRDMAAVPGLDITDPALVIRHGHEICAELAADTPAHVIVTEQHTYSGDTIEQTTLIVNATMRAYCPQYLKS